MVNAHKAISVLAVDDDSDSLYALQTLLQSNGFTVFTASNGQQALESARKNQPSLVLLDVNMPVMSGREAIKRFKSDLELRYIPVIFLTAKADVDDITAGLEDGADDYITKPYRPDEVVARINSALRLKRLYQELRSVEEQHRRLVSDVASHYTMEMIVAQSPAMHQILAVLEKVAYADSPVLIHGQSGTGKELIARALHYNSPRREKPFVVKNCATFNENLLESELFGYVRGAFTGATEDRKGLMQAAHGGTLFLDEIAEMSLPLQAKLLRVLQDGTFMAVGSTKEEKAQVRVVAATNRNLFAMVEQGSFREDLYYRLNVITLDVPPLRERTEDIPLLAQHFLDEMCDEKGIREKKLSSEVIGMLQQYPWKGNVRELKNEIERILIFYPEAEEISPEMLSVRIPDKKKEEELPSGGTLDELVAAVEKKAITRALQENRWNKSLTAKKLGLARSSLLAKIAAYNINQDK